MTRSLSNAGQLHTKFADELPVDLETNGLKAHNPHLGSITHKLERTLGEDLTVLPFENYRR